MINTRLQCGKRLWILGMLVVFSFTMTGSVNAENTLPELPSLPGGGAPAPSGNNTQNNTIIQIAPPFVGQQPLPHITVLPNNTGPVGTGGQGATLPVAPQSPVVPATATPLPVAPATVPLPIAQPPMTVSVQTIAPENTAPAAAPATAADLAAVAAVAAKNPDMLLTPSHLGNTSLMFSRSDMDVMGPFLELYDNIVRTKQTETNANQGDDLTALLQSLKSSAQANMTSQTPAAPPPLPNLYLGSIVYYSHGHWAVWINGKKVSDTRNDPHNEIYISRLARNEVEVIWKPVSLQETPQLWKRLTQGDKKPLDNIALDESKGTMTILLRTNQTFIPGQLIIREGLVKTPVAPMLDFTPSTAPAFKENLSLVPPVLQQDANTVKMPGNLPTPSPAAAPAASGPSAMPVIPAAVTPVPSAPVLQPLQLPAPR